MTGFYDDDDKITFDRAEELVEQFIRQYGKRINRATCKSVAQKFDVAESHHNLIRINNAMDEKLETVRESGSKATQYEVEQETETHEKRAGTSEQAEVE